MNIRPQSRPAGIGFLFVTLVIATFVSLSWTFILVLIRVEGDQALSGLQLRLFQVRLVAATVAPYLCAIALFAISAMVAAGFDGYLAVEGAKDGDQLSADCRSIAFVKRILRELGAE